jgi:hypothetical protein
MLLNMFNLSQFLKNKLQVTQNKLIRFLLILFAIFCPWSWCQNREKRISKESQVTYWSKSLSRTQLVTIQVNKCVDHVILCHVFFLSKTWSCSKLHMEKYVITQNTVHSCRKSQRFNLIPSPSALWVVRCGTVASWII